MIGRLAGHAAREEPAADAGRLQGVGYEVDVPMSTFYNLPAHRREGDAAHAPRRARGRAPAVRLRHATASARAFRQLIKISGVGARTALSVLSGMSVADLAQAVTLQEAGRLDQGARHRQEDRRAPAARTQGQARRRPRRSGRRRSRAAGAQSDILQRAAGAGLQRQGSAGRGQAAARRRRASPTASGRR